jgi:hypothetical protein
MRSPSARGILVFMHIHTPALRIFLWRLPKSAEFGGVVALRRRKSVEEMKSAVRGNPGIPERCKLALTVIILSKTLLVKICREFEVGKLIKLPILFPLSWNRFESYFIYEVVSYFLAEH